MSLLQYYIAFLNNVKQFTSVSRHIKTIAVDISMFNRGDYAVGGVFFCALVTASAVIMALRICSEISPIPLGL